MKRHAYLIMAHNEMEILKLLLSKLDCENNDLFLHFDKKVKFDKSSLVNICKKSKLSFIKRKCVFWGGYSQIKCELELLKVAIKGNYDYYHLITGVDLPIKSNDEIIKFFEEHEGKEFISYDSVANETMNFKSRYERKHFRRIRNRRNFLVKCINKTISVFEIIWNYVCPFSDKETRNLEMKKGSSYFDITHELAMYILSCEKKIRKIFRFSSCCDEVFLHTFAYNSKFRENIINNSTRFIDWHKHGSSPEVLTMQHYDEIINTEKLFARKFSWEKSEELIKKLGLIE